MHFKIITIVTYKFIINIDTVTQGMQPRYVPHQEPVAGAPLISTHTSHTSHQASQYGGQVPTGSGIHSNISRPGTRSIPAGMTWKSDYLYTILCMK